MNSSHTLHQLAIKKIYLPEGSVAGSWNKTNSNKNISGHTTGAISVNGKNET